VVGPLENFIERDSGQQYASFANVTAHFTRHFDVQVGGRVERDEQTGQLTSGGPLVGTTTVGPSLSSTVNAVTYLLTPRFRISSNLMAYARLASGFRPGGPNDVAALSVNVPQHYDPDKTVDYDVGLKGGTAGGLLSFDAALYYIKWKDIQVALTDPKTGAGYTSNASEAKSEGAELSVRLRPSAGLSISTSLAWNNAEMTKAMPPSSYINAVSGDRLPYSSRFSGHLMATQVFPLSDSATGFVGGELSYVGDRLSAFTGLGSAEPREHLPAFAQTDIRVGANEGTWTETFYVNNLTDRRGVLGDGWTGGAVLSQVYIQPRTIGLAVSKAF